MEDILLFTGFIFLALVLDFISRRNDSTVVQFKVVIIFVFFAYFVTFISRDDFVEVGEITHNGYLK